MEIKSQTILFNQVLYVIKNFYLIVDKMGLARDFNKAITFVKALNGDSFAMGDSFELKVSRLFPDSEFVCVHHTNGKDDLDGRMVENTLKPDFQFRHRGTGHLFWVECKYRSDADGDTVRWTKPEQLDRYIEFQKEVRPQKVYVAIGTGGLPSYPRNVYCIPLDNAHYPELYLSKLQKFAHDPGKPFEYVDFRVR
jgi:hypothetical protein